MTDPRATPVNARVAAMHLADAPAGLLRVQGTFRQIAEPVVNLLRTPEGKRDRQLLFGESLTVYEDRDGWSFVQVQKDGYVGYLPSSSYRPHKPATHWISAASSHVYSAPDIKSPDRLALSFGSRITVLSRVAGFAETSDGFVPSIHVTPINTQLTDPMDVAMMFLGTPYLWGGNSRFGIDCSGLVQAAWLACGRACPGDSDQQEETLGQSLPAGSPHRRGDLLFWKGHVAQVCDCETMVHANAFHMAVVCEPIEPALARIAAQGDGPVTSHRRL